MDNVPGRGKEQNEDIRWLISRAAHIPEIREIVSSANDRYFATKSIVPILLQKFDKLADFLQVSGDNTVNIARQIVDAILDNNSEEENITEYDIAREKFFKGDFTFDDVVAQIVKVDDWKPEELKMSAILRDINGEIISFDIMPKDEAEALPRLGRYVTYSIMYPAMDIGGKEVFPEFPHILKTLYDSEMDDIYTGMTKLSAKEQNDFTQKHEENRLIFEYEEDGRWHERFDMGGWE